MAKIRVGVKRLGHNGFEVDQASDERFIEFTQQWIEINGIRFSAEDVDLLGVSYDGVPRDEDGIIHPAEIFIRMNGSFEVVDHRDEPDTD